MYYLNILNFDNFFYFISNYLLYIILFINIVMHTPIDKNNIKESWKKFTHEHLKDN
jgi:hypothetical protein